MPLLAPPPFRAVFSVALALFIVVAGGSHAAGLPAEPLPTGTFLALESGRPTTVVAYGTSLTAGGAWTRELAAYWEKHYPGKVTFLNAAKNGMHSGWGVENLAERVIEKSPDLVLIEFAVNDAAARHGISPQKSVANLETMAAALRARNPAVEIVVQTMNPAWDSPRVPEKKYGSDRPELAAYYDAWRDGARRLGLPLVEHYPTWLKIQREEPERFRDLVPDGIHPGEEASRQITWAGLESFLERARAAARHTLSLEAQGARSEGANPPRPVTPAPIALP